MTRTFSGFKDKYGLDIYIRDYVELDGEIYTVRKWGSGTDHSWITLVGKYNTSIGELKDLANKCTLMKLVPAVDSYIPPDDD